MKISFPRSMARLLIPLLLAAGLVGPAHAQAPAFPNKPVKLIVPFLAGGAPDMLARMVGERLSARWGQPVVIDNKPGASGALGAQALKASPADGYSFLMAVSSLVQLPHLIPNIPYDVKKDFAAVSHLGGTHLALLVNSNLPVNTLQEFIAYTKARPGKLNYASFGAGSLSHIFGEVFNDAAGVQLQHVAYKGDSPALVDLMEGRVESAFLSVFLVRQHLASGKLKMLAVTGPTRSPLAPTVPTMDEQGIRGLGLQGWFGLFAPAGTPVTIQEKVAVDLRDILTLPEIKAKLLESGIVAGGGTAAAFAHTVSTDYDMYGEIIRKYRISLN
ncbi:Bug family tripartite tricarboxylate transporter substrate binding protein [Hydrogenophaga sp. OTU3427]|uniref:Bug family tripartite tricarboxylate transporter substrate binding protein n=1 Tax=Hydrogenophaga sp. OTU3427 TaxID=3043856 RepID=UPI00313DEF52